MSTANVTSFDIWMTRELKRIKGIGVSEPEIKKFLEGFLVRVRRRRESLYQLTDQLNEAFLAAQIAIKDAPWLNMSHKKITYVEVEITGFDEPISATI